MGYFIDRKYRIPQVTESDYGFDWPLGPRGEKVDQITKELLGFRLNGSRKGFLSRYEHGLNLVRLLWPEDVVLSVKWRHHKTGEEVVIWNNYFLRIFRAVCENKRVCLTGCSSSGKTYAVAVYCLLLFFSDPEYYTIMISTTAATDAERRVWGDIKALHRSIAEIYPVGTLIDYLHTITFDPGKELEGRRDVKDRDIRNGLMIIPIPKGSEGENALGRIIGTKNGRRDGSSGGVIWVIEEMPHMLDDILRPVSNLESNWFQLIGIGNANTKNDPHGKMGEPKDTWDSVSQSTEEWEGKSGTKVLFLHGESSPNFHPAVDQTKTERQDYPYPYLSSPPYINRVAELNGHGNIEAGKRTIDYMRFAVGFWYGEGIQTSVLSSQQVREFGADRREVPWGHKKLRYLCGADFAWTAGGDSIELAFGLFGEDQEGFNKLLLPEETVGIFSTAKEREGFRTDIAKQIVAECEKRKVLPADFFCDINADGGLMMQAIQREWDSHECVGLSSLEPPENSERHSTRVTQYWFQMSDGVCSGNIFGFNITSRYANEFFTRQYESVGAGKVKLEKKVDYKKRLKHSPDSGDAVSYLVEGAKLKGLPMTRVSQAPEDTRRRFDDLIQRRGQQVEDDTLGSHEAAASEEDEGAFDYATYDD